MSTWIHAAEAALDGRTTGSVEVEVIERHAPPVLDATGLRALVSPLLAGFLWSTVVLRETQTRNPLDPLDLLLRVLALALSVRAILLTSQLLSRLFMRISLSRYGLALTDEGLFYRGPQGDVVVPRQDVLEVRERGQWRNRSGRRWAEVYVITRPESGRLYLALPPVFERTAGVLAERLMRWAGVPEDADKSAEPPEPAGLASRLWEQVAAGERPAGVTAIAHGSGWLRRGPYASVLLALAVFDGFLRLPANLRAAVSGTAPIALFVTLLLVPLAWIVLMRRDIARRSGIALVLTPAELLVRTRAGVQRVLWESVTRLSIDAKSSWSLLQGAYQTRTILLERSDGDLVTFQEVFLSLPAEVLVSLCDAYRKGRIR